MDVPFHMYVHSVQVKHVERLLVDNHQIKRNRGDWITILKKVYILMLLTIHKEKEEAVVRITQFHLMETKRHSLPL